MTQFPCSSSSGMMSRTVVTEVFTAGSKWIHVSTLLIIQLFIHTPPIIKGF